MLCWFQSGVTDSFGGFEALHDGIGLVEGSACPHYDRDPQRRTLYHQLIRDGFPAGYAEDDGAALHFVGRELVEVVSSRPDASAYRVSLRDGRVQEEELATRFLGA
jgi:peptidase E